MHPAPTPEQGTLAAIVAAAPVLTALEADFRRNRWTFTLPPQPVGPGEYLVLWAPQAIAALKEAERDPLALRDAVRVDDEWSEDITYGGRNGHDKFSRRRFCPDSWRESRIAWHPSHWRQYCSRVDANGRRWDLEHGSIVHVMDDFGTLVPVPEALQ